MAGIMVFPPLRSYNNQKGVEKTESIEKYEKRKLKKSLEIHPLETITRQKGWKNLKV